MKMLQWMVPGVLALSLTACGGGGTDSCRLTLGGMACGSVTPDNLPPVARTGLDQFVKPSQVVTLDGSMSTDANNDRLTYTWTVVDQPVGSALTLSPDDAAVKPTFTPVVAGVYEFKLTVSDGQFSDTAKTLVTVTPANVPPVANAGLNQSVLVNRLVTLDGSASSDQDAAATGQVLTYSWLLNVPAGSQARLFNEKTVNPVFYPDVAGTYTASLQVSDGVATSGLALVSVQAASDNAAPTADAGLDQTVPFNTVVTLDGSGSKDTDGFVNTLTWTVLHTPKVGSPPTSVPITLDTTDPKRPKFTPPVVGDYVLSLSVTDNKGLVSTQSDTVAISAVNSAPVANAGSPQTVTLGAAPSLAVTATGSGTDANGDALTYKWVLTKPNGSTQNLPSTASVTFNVTVTGNHALTLVVNDGKVDSAPSTVLITVN